MNISIYFSKSEDNKKLVKHSRTSNANNLAYDIGYSIGTYRDIMSNYNRLRNYSISRHKKFKIPIVNLNLDIYYSK